LEKSKPGILAGLLRSHRIIDLCYSVKPVKSFVSLAQAILDEWSGEVVVEIGCRVEDGKAELMTRLKLPSKERMSSDANAL